MSPFNPRFPLSFMNASFDPRDETGRQGEPGSGSPGGRGRVGPLSAEEQAIWSAHEAELSGRHHRIFVARVRGRVEGERLELALERLAARHEELRSTFHETGSGPRRRVRSTAEFHLEFVDARRWSEEELDEIVRLTSRQPIDLSVSPFRAVLFTRGEADHALLLIAHRIAVGARRLRQILSDLRSLYDGADLPLLSADPVEAQHPQPSRAFAGISLLLPSTSAESVMESGEAGLHRRFEGVASVAPERIALSDGMREVSYGELDQAANRIARVLRNAGVDPRCCVALDLPLSAEAVAAHLAVLKLGAICLPCGDVASRNDPAALLRAAAPAALVTVSGRHADGAALPPIVIDLDDATPALTTVSSQPLGIIVPTEQTAVIGLRVDSGIVRSVPLSHTRVTRLLDSVRRELQLTADRRVLASGPIGPRELLLDILLPLTTGSTIVLAGDVDVAVPARLAAALAAPSIAVARLATPALEALIANGWRGADHLQLLCDARELTPELAAALSSRVAGLRPLYGHLETTLCCASATARSDGRIVVEEPLGASTLHLLNEELDPAEVGEVGTIYVGGPGVVRGYLTAPPGGPDAFIPDPFSADGRGLLFRTGDRARRRADGSLELLDTRGRRGLPASA